MTKTNELPGIALPPEIMDDLTRREFLIGAGLIALAPGCGNGGESGDGETSANTRAIEHELGETEVPVEPRRVIAIDPYSALPTALLVGASVVGTSQLPYGEPFPPYLDESETRGVEDVGWGSQINLEAIAALEPDLIIGIESFVEEPYEELSQISSTVATKSFFETDWKPIVRMVSETLGRREEVEDDISAYERRIVEFKERAGRLDALEVTLVNIRALNDIRIYTGDFASRVMAEAGVRRAANQREENLSLELTIESLSEADADVIFYYVGSAGTNPEEAAEQTERIQSNPLWDNLEAVQNDRVYQVNPEWWFNGGSVQTANLVLDDLEEFLVRG